MICSCKHNTPVNHYGNNLVPQLSNCKKTLFQAECYQLVTVNFDLIGNAKKHVRRNKHLYNEAKRTGLDVDWFQFKDVAAISRKTCKKAYNNYISLSVASNNESISKRFFRKYQKSNVHALLIRMT